ncbi:MAG: potassium-transporting ATPase subunit KdpC [Solirubrobacteraceae bacterium]|nr:potassium-transporting ATPase subunit KdpC [Solirubrobacteraceae bacterium]
MTATAPLRQLFAGLRVLLALTLVLGLAYPLAITGVAQIAAPGNANGSRVSTVANANGPGSEGGAGRVVGSDLVGQPFDGPQWFHPRPSAAGEDGYDTLASGASNLGPNNPDLAAAVQERLTTYRAENGLSAGQRVPADAVTAGASGLDPDISVENARLQSARVARARSLAPAAVAKAVNDATKGRTLGILGEPRVNVLRLNLALDRLRR